MKTKQKSSRRFLFIAIALIFGSGLFFAITQMTNQEESLDLLYNPQFSEQTMREALVFTGGDMVASYQFSPAFGMGTAYALTEDGQTLYLDTGQEWYNTITVGQIISIQGVAYGEVIEIASQGELITLIVDWFGTPYSFEPTPTPNPDTADL